MTMKCLALDYKTVTTWTFLYLPDTGRVVAFHEYNNSLVDHVEDQDAVHDLQGRSQAGVQYTCSPGG